MPSQLPLFAYPDDDPTPMAIASDDREPLLSEAEEDRVYGTLEVDEHPGLFDGILVSEGVPISPREVEELTLVERRRQDEAYKREPRWQCSAADRKAIADSQRADEVRRHYAELAAEDRRKAAETRRAMGKGR